MKLSADQVKQGILSPEQLVRDVALRYFSESFSPDPTIMPLAIQAIETYGWKEAFHLTHSLSDLVQTEDTLLWLIDQLNRLDHPKAVEDAELCWRLSSIIANADVSLLMEHEAKVLELEYLEPQEAEVISERLRLLTVDTDTCWRDLEQFCEDRKGEQGVDRGYAPHANRLGEAIARGGDAYADQILTILSQTQESYENNPMAFMECFVAWLAGELRMEQAVPLLVAKLKADPGDLMNEECQRAFIKVGTDSAVENICEDWSSAPWHYRLYASSSLEHIHSDLAISRSLELHGQEAEMDIQSHLIRAVLNSFSSEGVEPARQMVLRGNREPRRGLVAAATLMGVSFPELEQWKTEEKKLYEKAERSMEQWLASPPPKAKPKPFSFDNLIDPPPQPPIARKEKVGRNDPCPCGSGRKYKKCCMGKK